MERGAPLFRLDPGAAYPGGRSRRVEGLQQAGIGLLIIAAMVVLFAGWVGLMKLWNVHPGRGAAGSALVLLYGVWCGVKRLLAGLFTAVTGI